MKSGVIPESAIREIRESVEKYSLTYLWLLNEIREESGIVSDKTELSAILGGKRQGPKAREIVDTALDILRGYQNAKKRRWPEYSGTDDAK